MMTFFRILCEFLHYRRRVSVLEQRARRYHELRLANEHLLREMEA